MRYLENVITLEFDEERCNACGMCVHVCPHAVFARTGRRVVLRDLGACMECGACAKNCESGAIRVRAGVGCAAAVISGFVAGTEPSCGCGEDSSGGCCG